MFPHNNYIGIFFQKSIICNRTSVNFMIYFTFPLHRQYLSQSQFSLMISFFSYANICILCKNTLKGIFLCTNVKIVHLH